ncbi:MAG: hypothetical protein L6R39_004822 [Caloplaca ligustica]|nr:MAG: hypothetical protein L6R39_004822 [Caloplaca ligustica]
MAALRPLSAREEHEVQLARARLNLAPVPDCSTYPYFAVAPVEDKGQGCIAQTNISRGTRIHMERLLFSIDDVGERTWSQANKNALNHALTLPQNQIFHNLINPFTRYRAADQINKGRFGANNFQLTVWDDHRKCPQGIFPEAARFNHSCIPNAWYNWNPQLESQDRESPGRLTVHAIEDIKRGEEIVVNYQHENAYGSQDKRRGDLFTDYSFWCRCPACLDGSLSEQRRKEMEKVDSVLRNNQGAQRGERWIRHEYLLRLIRLLDQEGLVYPQKATSCGDLADWYFNEWNQPDCTIKDPRQCRDKFMEAARGRLDAEILCLGEDSEEVRVTLDAIARRS